MRTADQDARAVAMVAVADCLAAGPAPLGAVVGRIEAALGDSPAIRSVAALLQEMARGGHIHLTNDGRSWTVSSAFKPEAAMGNGSAFGRLRQWLGRACY